MSTYVVLMVKSVSDIKSIVFTGGSVVISKYPITNFNTEFVQEDSWKYGYYMIEKNNEKYYFLM